MSYALDHFTSYNVRLIPSYDHHHSTETLALMRAMRSRYSNPSTIQLLKESESHVSPYLNNAYTDHECFSLVVPNELSLQCNEVFYLFLPDFH